MEYSYKIKNGECQLFENNKMVLEDDVESISAYIIDLTSSSQEEILGALICEFEARD